MGYDLFPHKSGLGLMEPIALINQNVCIKYENIDQFRKISWLEPLPPFQFLNIGPVAAFGTSARTQAVALQLWTNEFAQLRWWLVDPIQCRLYLPNASGRFNLRNLQVPVDPTITDKDPDLHLTEMFVWEDRNPAYEATNISGAALTQARIMAQGFRYVTEKLDPSVVTAIKAGKEACTYVVASGYAGQNRTTVA